MRTRLLVLLLSAAAIACTVENDASIRVTAICTEPKPAANGACVYPAKCDTLQMELWGDLLAVNQVFAPVQWNNNLPDNSDVASGLLNTNVARVESYRISYAAAGVSLPDVEVPIIADAVGTGASQVNEVSIVPPAIAQLLLPTVAAAPVQVLVYIRAKGHLAGGSSFETAPLRTPLSLAAVAAYSAYVPVCKDATQFAVPCPQFGQSDNWACISP
jgi:hypothetical protein